MDVSFIFVFLVSFLGCHICDAVPTAETRQGLVQGTYKKSYEGRIFSAFEGIPYAKPPVGDLRFRAPVAATDWEGTLVANTSYICSQYVKDSVIGSEDCLYLNVYIPKEEMDTNDKLDVIVHIHGGPWVNKVKGSPYDTALPDYLMDKDVILVTFNYRLDAPGFLSTGDDVVPGNNGFRDQNLALWWVKLNIKAFGGNPDSVTLTGFSFGGASVQFHYLSPLSKGLFHKGYSASGAVTNPGSLTINPLEQTKLLAEIVKCPVETTTGMVDCLRKVPIEELVYSFVEFKPAVEEGKPYGFLPEVPYKLLQDKKVHDVPFVMSNVIDEDMFSLANYINRSETHLVCKYWQEWGKAWLDLKYYVDEDRMEETLNELEQYYLDDCELTEEDGYEKLNKIMSDRHFFIGADRSLRAQAAATKSPVYYYLSKYIPEDSLQLLGPRVASHGVDSKLLFKFRTNSDKLKPEDEKMMQLFTEFIADYADTGIPRIGNVEWVPIDPEQQSLNVLEINSPKDIKMTIVEELAPRKFWDSLPIKENSHLI